MSTMTQLLAKTLESPEETRAFSHGKTEVGDAELREAVGLGPRAYFSASAGMLQSW